ncbi:hypothetical protein FGU64_15825 [Mesorhizobium sp. 8]|nr:hypothetical protein FGU64_15825 [Mesorhizobium sp. 8]
MLRRTARRDRMVGLFAAGTILLNPPILNLVGGTLFGWPALYLYLFGVWGLLIAVIGLISEGSAGQANERDKDSASR